jgi:hypothetical protein
VADEIAKMRADGRFRPVAPKHRGFAVCSPAFSVNRTSFTTGVEEAQHLFNASPSPLLDRARAMAASAAAAECGGSSLTAAVTSAPLNAAAVSLKRRVVIDYRGPNDRGTAWLMSLPALIEFLLRLRPGSWVASANSPPASITCP